MSPARAKYRRVGKAVVGGLPHFVSPVGRRKIIYADN